MCFHFLLDIFSNLFIMLSLFAIRPQEDKEAMFDCYDTVHAVLQVTTGVMSTLQVRDFHQLSVLKTRNTETGLMDVVVDFHAEAIGILFFRVSVCTCHVTFSWTYLRNTLTVLLLICHKHSQGLQDEMIQLWSRSKVKVTVSSQKVV